MGSCELIENPIEWDGGDMPNRIPGWDTLQPQKLAILEREIRPEILAKAEHGKPTVFQVNTRDLEAANF